MIQSDLKNILVTGAEGFIGSHYARLLYKTTAKAV